MSNSFIIFGVIVLAILGPSAVIAAVGYSSIRALGRNPSSAPKIMMAMIFILVFAEATAIIALMVLFHLLGE